jgi:PD-(D/E)XK nuclease superfamily
MVSRRKDSPMSEDRPSVAYPPEVRGKVTNYNQSRIKQFRRCQKQYSFRYDYPGFYGKKGKMEMIPLKKRLPLYRGSWMHALQEAHHHSWADIPEFKMVFGEGRNALEFWVQGWEDVQETLTEQFNNQFDEEKEELGDLPAETKAMWREYLKFWKDDFDRYTVATLPDGEPAIEFIVECPLDKFGLKNAAFKGKIDLLVEDKEYDGLWIWDAKWVKSIPPPDERMMSPQACLYVWALRETYDLDVRGFVYNYGRTKAPAQPRVLLNGTLSVAAKMDTTYATYLTAVKKTHGEKWKNWVPYYLPKLKALKGREALWFDRERIPVEDDRILLAIREYTATVRDIQRREKRREYVPRSYFYSCAYSCDYHSLCAAEFQGIEIEPMIKQYFDFTGERYEQEDLLRA